MLGGALLEASVIAFRVTPTPLLDRVDRVERILFVVAFAALAALAAGLPVWAWSRSLRQRLRESRADVSGIVAATAGIATCAWLALGFLVRPPDSSLLQTSIDPITERAPMLALAAILVFLVSVPFGQGLSRMGLARGIAGASAACAVALGLAHAPGGTQDTERDRPDKIQVSVDTHRADHQGCYGYSLPTSPALDRLCRDSIVFENAMSAAPQTIPSYASIFTGLQPSEHRVFSNSLKMDDSFTTLPEILQENGYLTGAVLHGAFPAPFGNLDQGLEILVQRGITAYSPLYTLADAARSLASVPLVVLNDQLSRDASVTTDEAVRWITHLSTNRPLFLHVYWSFPHGPYTPPSRYLEDIPRPGESVEFRDKVHRYDAEVGFADAQLARVLEAIERRGADRPAWVVFTADHGEELGRDLPERDAPFFGHSFVLYDSSLRVPLVVRPPRRDGSPARRHHGVVTNASLAATLLEAAGIDAPPGMLPPLPLSEEEAKRSDLALSVMRDMTGRAKHGLQDWVSIRSEGWRLIEKRVPARDLELLKQVDGGEEVAVISEHPRVFERLSRELHRVYPPDEGRSEGSDRALSEKESEMLTLLGYIE
jgi:hypothetical protein